MSRTDGRAEKRIHLTLPLEISKVKDPNSAERTVTENVCSTGARVLARRRVEPDEQLMVNSSKGDLRTKARVVYCQKLSRERFALGLEFRGAKANWLKRPGISA